MAATSTMVSAVLPSLRLRSRWLTLPAALGVVALLTLSLLSIGEEPSLAIRTEPLPDGSERVTWLMPGGPYWEKSPRPGDAVRVLPPVNEQGWPSVVVVAGPRAGQVLSLSPQWSHAVQTLLLLLGFEFLATGLFTLSRATDRPTAHRLGTLSLLLAALLINTPALNAGSPTAVVVDWLALMGAVAAFAEFALTTPVRRWNRLRRLILALLAPFLIAYAYTVLVAPGLYDLLKSLRYGYGALGIGVGLAALAWPFVFEGRPDQRRLWPILLSAGLAGLMVVGLWVVPFLAGEPDLISPSLVPLPLAVLPLGFIWVVVRHRFMGIEVGHYGVLRTVFDTVADPVFVVDREERLVDANHAGLALLGVERLGQARDSFRPLLTSREAADERALPTSVLLGRVLGGEAIRDAEQALRLPGDGVAFLSVSGTPVSDASGRVSFAVLVYRDVTTRVESQRLREERLALLAHDLRTPLAVIQTQAQLLIRRQRPDADPEQQRGLQRITSSTRHLSALLTDLVEVTRLETGLVTPRLERLSLAKLLAELPVWTAGEGQGERVQVAVDSDSQVQADPMLLSRALSNVVTNALRYTPDDQIVELRAGLLDGEAHVVVADHGPGIPPDDLPRIFERRYRGKTSAGTEGTGLGLYITKMIVNLHGGRVWAESRPGEGTAFHLTFPATWSREQAGRRVADGHAEL